MKWRMVMAPKVHAAPQAPQPAQAASITVATSFFLQVMAPYGQTEAQSPHIVQASGSMTLVMASILISPALSNAPARDDAAPAWQTESLMSLGDSQKPAK